MTSPHSPIPAAEPVGDLVTVPREPTREMISAGYRHWNKTRVTTPDLIYRAMLAAAPASAIGVSEAAMREIGSQGMTPQEAETLIEEMRSTIAAYEERDRLAALSVPKGETAQGVEVKALEWKRFDRDREFAQTAFGSWMTDSVSGLVTVEFRGVIQGDIYPTVEAAKAFAQADYNRRILSALAHPSVKEEGASRG